ncbi:MAG: AAA family ATPase [Chloroflexota bacterium]|nr:AAA family ATPase [Chloroflexota bacterium]
MEPSVIEEVRLTAFKSFRDAVLPLDALTLIVGRNGSGKSNALDGLRALARLAQGENVSDALDGGREGPAVRGGVTGCAPFGESLFTLGCSVRTGASVVDLDVTIQSEPVVQVVHERLAIGDRELLATEPPPPDSSNVSARWDGDEAPPSPALMFRNSRLLATQVLSRVPATSAGQRVHLAAAQVLAALRALFVLDPAPRQMRQYVARRDVLLRSDADNLSAAVASLLESPGPRDQLRSALSELDDQEIVDVTTSRSELDDLMLTLVERFRGAQRQVPARIMSDGSLRFLAILVALMQVPTVDAMPEPLASEDPLGQTTVVIEELGNGLHASQETKLVDLIRAEVERRRVQLLATTHSPAVLDALTGEEHKSVIICQRDREGRSTLTRLVDLPRYADIVAKGGLGRAAVADRLRSVDQPRDPRAVLNEILGGPAG